METLLKSGIHQIAGPGGKVYVGQSQNVTKRLGEHRRLLRAGKHFNAKLQSSFTLHGDASFAFEPLMYFDVSELNAAEQIALDALPVERYNLSSCAEATQRGLPKSELARHRMSVAKTGVKRGPHSAETRAKIGAAHKGKTLTPAHRALMSQQRKGKPMSDACRKARALTLSTPRTAESIAKTVAANTGRKRSLESRMRMSASRKAYLLAHGDPRLRNRGTRVE